MKLKFLDLFCVKNPQIEKTKQEIASLLRNLSLEVL